MAELEAMPCRELTEWTLYFKLKEEEEKRKALDQKAAQGLEAQKQRRRAR